jgi:Domain of unknown function (DUF4169)
MAEIVNLRQARKRKQRQREEAVAAERRIAFGRSKAERRLSEQERSKAERDLESHRIARLDGE